MRKRANNFVIKQIKTWICLYSTCSTDIFKICHVRKEWWISRRLITLLTYLCNCWYCGMSGSGWKCSVSGRSWEKFNSSRASSIPFSCNCSHTRALQAKWWADWNKLPLYHWHLAFIRNILFEKMGEIGQSAHTRK